MKLTFRNTKDDGSPRAMAGYWRPRWNDVDDAFYFTSDVWPGSGGSTYEQGRYDSPVYVVDDDEIFEETHCLILGLERCPDVDGRTWVAPHLETTAARAARVRARHANCPEEARPHE